MSQLSLIKFDNDIIIIYVEETLCYLFEKPLSQNDGILARKNYFPTLYFNSKKLNFLKFQWFKKKSKKNVKVSLKFN